MTRQLFDAEILLRQRKSIARYYARVCQLGAIDVFASDHFAHHSFPHRMYYPHWFRNRKSRLHPCKTCHREPVSIGVLGWVRVQSRVLVAKG